MSIQTISGPITMDPSTDFVRTTLGLTWGIKCRIIGDVAVVMAVVKRGSEWVLDNGILDNSFDLNIDKYSDTMSWLKQKLLPALNAWLALVFKAGVITPPTNTITTRLIEADAMIFNLLKITVAADGTVVASL